MAKDEDKKIVTPKSASESTPKNASESTSKTISSIPDQKDHPEWDEDKKEEQDAGKEYKDDPLCLGVDSKVDTSIKSCNFCGEQVMSCDMVTHYASCSTLQKGK